MNGMGAGGGTEMEPHEIAKLTDREILMLTCQKVHGLEKMEPRVKSLEDWRLYMTGIGTAITAVLGIMHVRAMKILESLSR